jgi:hypothetical protein
MPESQAKRVGGKAGSAGAGFKGSSSTYQGMKSRLRNFQNCMNEMKYEGHGISARA